MLPIQSFVLLVSMFAFFKLSLGSNDGYIFTMPNTVWAGRSEQACLTMYGKLERSDAIVTITVANTVTKILIGAAYPECFQVNIPQTAEWKEQIQLDIDFLDYPDYNVHKVNNLYFNQPKEKIFIQTDRTTYKPGDLVKLRILLFKNDLSVPKNLMIPTVRIRNPLNIVVAQWNNVSTKMGLVQLEHQLSEETTLGTWIIELPKNKNSRKTFEVKEYVLPRFDITINHANRLYARQKSYNFTICSKYTYGAPLLGTAQLDLKTWYSGKELNTNDIKNLEQGCSEFIFNDDLMQDLSGSIELLATVTEQGTGQKETLSKYVYLSSRKSFDLKVSPSLFQPGIPFQGIVDITGNSEDIVDKTIDVCFGFAFGSPCILNYTKIRCNSFPIIDNKRTEFVIFPFRDKIHSIYITAQIGNETKRYHTVNRWYSPSNSYIQISHESPDKAVKCQTWHPFTIIYTLPKYASKQLPIEFHYLIKSKGDIIKFGKIYHIPNKTSTFKKRDYNNTFDTKFKPNMFLGKFILTINIDQKLYSEGELLVYYVRKDGEIVSNSIKFDVENCLANKVDAGWQESQVYPGDLTTFNIKASRGSLCAVSAVDKATHLLSPVSNLNIEMLLKDIPKTSQDSRHNEPNTCKKPVDNLDVDYDDYVNETHLNYVNSPFRDTFDVLHDMRLLVLTNLKTVTKPCIAGNTYADTYYKTELLYKTSADLQMPAFSFKPLSSQSVDMGVPERSYFPETWLFDLVHVGDSGETNFYQSIPHTITQWIGNTYCVSPSTGIGVAPTSYITSFKPFFVDLLTPYAIKRNEVSHLKVIAFNYLNHSLPIKISLDLNDNLKLVGSPRIFTACLRSGDSVTNEFKVTAFVDGRMNIRVTADVDSSYPTYCKPPKPITGRDVIIKNILVHVEGFPIEETKSSYVCLNEHSAEADRYINWPMSLPDNAVPNYARINTLLDADFMELTVGNIGSILQLPTGCGEQIIATVAPNLYILRYLKALDKLTPEIQEKIYGYMRTGYEQILRYRHYDGSFSVFGERYTESSVFLTAFVMRVLAQSSEYVYIDENVIKKAQSWIIKQQDERGCFSPSLRYKNRNNAVVLTAYVLISIKDSGLQLPRSVLDKAKFCLTNSGSFNKYQTTVSASTVLLDGVNVDGNPNNKYQMAISAYALLLNGATVEANKILDRLLEISNKQQNLVWWEDPYSSSARAVEITAYAILALMSSNNMEYRGVAHGAIRWLLTRRNPTGGFISTQDTVVALDALTEYALLMANNTNTDLSITVATDNKQDTYKIDNSMTPRNKQLSRKEFSNSISFKLDGTGCVLVQNTLRYNVQEIQSSNVLMLNISLKPMWRNNKCDFTNVKLCVAYTVPDKNINMALLEFNLPSGYGADRHSLSSLSTHKSAYKRYEIKDDKVIFYYSELNNKTVCTSFLIEEQSIIENRTASIVRIYDYYNPIVYASKKYEIPQCVKPANEINIIKMNLPLL